MSVTDHLRYRKLLRNSFVLAIGRLPGSVGIKLLTVLPLVIVAVVS